jgi:hypothetical protein
MADAEILKYDGEEEEVDEGFDIDEYDTSNNNKLTPEP